MKTKLKIKLKTKPTRKLKTKLKIELQKMKKINQYFPFLASKESHNIRVPVVRIDSHRFENNFMNREAVRSGSVPLRFVSRPVHGFIRFHSVRFLSGIDCIITFYIL